MVAPPQNFFIIWAAQCAGSPPALNKFPAVPCNPPGTMEFEKSTHGFSTCLDLVSVRRGKVRQALRPRQGRTTRTWGVSRSAFFEGQGSNASTTFRQFWHVFDALGAFRLFLGPPKTRASAPLLALGPLWAYFGVPRTRVSHLSLRSKLHNPSGSRPFSSKKVSFCPVWPTN